MKLLPKIGKAVGSLGWPSFALAAMALVGAQPAQACSYSQEPEPVGHASAEFFASRMAPEASFVDVAVAETTAPAFGAATPWPVHSTTFRVVYRFKGQSPDRFSLYVGELPSGEAIPQARHFVDEAGRVTPYPYPHEGGLTHPGVTNSCDPGTLRVRLGQAYLIFREADGRLLDRVRLYDDREARLFPIMPVTLDESIGWLQAGLVATVPDRQPRVDAPSSDLQAVRFEKGLTEEEAVRWARRAGVRPVAVSTARGKLIQESRVPVEHAQLDLIADAFAKARRPKTGEKLRALAKQFLDEDDERLSLDLALQTRANLLIESASAEPPPGTPARLVAMEVTGAPEALARLPSAPQVAESAPGFIRRGRVAAPSLVRGAAPAFPYQINRKRETGPSVRRRLQALLEGRPLPPPEFVPPEPTPDPFSHTGCIRIGDAEALALNHPLISRFREFMLYASPATADCTQTADALTCRLAPNSAVRLDFGGRIGGFRVGPDPARFELREDGILCGRVADIRDDQRRE